MLVSNNLVVCLVRSELCVVEVHYEELKGLSNNTTVDILRKLSLKSIKHTNVAILSIMVMAGSFILEYKFLTVIATL